MKPFAIVLAGFGLLSPLARADEKVEVKKDKNDVQIEKQHKEGKRTHKTKVKSHARARAGGGTVSKTETTEETDRPGIGNDSKTKTAETKEKDAHRQRRPRGEEGRQVGGRSGFQGKPAFDWCRRGARLQPHRRRAWPTHSSHLGLHTYDLARAKAFYSRLSGWKLQDVPMPGPGSTPRRNPG